jgi:hypothetical protein
VRALEAHFGSLTDATFEVHAGAAYRNAIEGPLERLGARLVVPLVGLPLGSQLAWYARHARPTEGARDPAGGGQRSTNIELKLAMLALGGQSQRIAAQDWSATAHSFASPGLYSWFVDPAGATGLSQGLGSSVRPGRIYAGQAGATKWPSGKVGRATLASRIGANHLRGNIRNSTFRLTLAASLAGPLGLVTTAPRRLDKPSELALSTWMADHLSVAVHPFSDRDALDDLEHRVLAALDPPLNLERMPRTTLRTNLSLLRAGLG